MNEIIDNIYEGILNGEKGLVTKYVQAALEGGLKPETILHEGMIKAMDEVGRRFENEDYFIPEMLIAARAMQEGLRILKPALVKAKIKSSGKVIIGTVKGDLHDIGKNLVSMMLEGAAYEVIDLGTDVPPAKFIEAVKSSGAQYVAMSALLTTTMANMILVINAFESAGLRDKVKIIVGGASLTQQYAEQIGADGYSPDAMHAVALVKSLLV